MSVAMDNTSPTELPMSHPLKWLWLSLVLIVADQVTKFWAVKRLSDGSTIDILPIFDFSLVYNTGAAFGLLNDAGGWQKIFFAVIATVVSVFLVFAMKTAKRSEKQLVIAYACIISGAIGNLLDRVRIEKVVDFIHVFYQNYHFPHFNIADIAISIGAFLLILDALNWKLIK